MKEIAHDNVLANRLEKKEKKGNDDDDDDDEEEEENTERNSREDDDWSYSGSSSMKMKIDNGQITYVNALGPDKSKRQLPNSITGNGNIKDENGKNYGGRNSGESEDPESMEAPDLLAILFMEDERKNNMRRCSMRANNVNVYEIHGGSNNNNNNNDNNDNNDNNNNDKNINHHHY